MSAKQAQYDEERLTREAEAAKAVIESLKLFVGDSDDEELKADSVEGETSFVEVMDRILADYIETEGLAEGIDDTIKRLKARQKRLEDSNIRRRTVIEQALTMADIKTMKRPLATLTLGKGAIGIEIQDESRIPSRFWKREPVLDKSAVRTAVVTDGEDVPGVARTNGAPKLTIRVA